MYFNESFLTDLLGRLKIVLLIAITITDGKTLQMIDVSQNSGSDDIPRTPPLGTIVVVDDGVSQEDIIESFVNSATDNETLGGKMIDPNHRSTSIVGMGNHEIVKKSREYKETSYSKSQYRILEPDRGHAALERNAAILRFDLENNGNGTYSYAYETENGIYAEESGVAKNGVVVQGEYSYIGDDGVKYTVRYSADENGFRPQGDHFPTPPPVPEAILKALEQNARDEAAGIYDDGSYDERQYGGDVDQGSAIVFVVSNKVKVKKEKSSADDKIAVDAAASSLRNRSEFINAANLKYSNK